MDPSGDHLKDAAPKRAPRQRDAARVAKMYRKKTRRLERDLYVELGKNVDLYNRKNKAVAVLKRLSQENCDLLDVLSQTLEQPSVSKAERTALSAEQEELFDLENI